MRKRRDNAALRDAFTGLLMTVGPFFGVRYQPPRTEIPVVATPAGEDIDPATAPRPLGHDGGGAAQPARDEPGDGARL